MRQNITREGSNTGSQDELRRSRTPSSSRNLIAFWILGLCNNFAYVVMLSAAKDILETDIGSEFHNSTHACRDVILDRHCQKLSTGAVLLADIVPAFVVKISAPLYIQSVPFGLRHVFVVTAQILSFILVAASNNVSLSLLGVVVTSLGSGLGEVSYLALASHFDARVISTWSSGTGGAGIIGAITYAVLTDQLMLHLSPRAALYGMLVVPLVFAYTFWFVLELPHSVHKITICNPKTYFVPLKNDIRLHRNFQRRRLQAVIPLLKYMVPLVVVYFSEYFINQGLFELLEFNCSQGLGLTPASQYRWYQVLYQVGVFISRSSSDCIALPGEALPVLALLQVLNVTIFYLESVTQFISHILLLMCLIVYEGLLGGASYVNTFKVIHQEIPADRKEFSLGFVSISDTFGIVLAGFIAIPVHNVICERPL
ncbi:CLN3 protein [Dictyocaulus viviparus]|uniref:Battenin n=1 Tax=Dictyocaulus viviparus TaxID=29172 RepID=A0A0D8Y0Q6_DICVI|nr:CLN3 protein [Dictyocaulus viviparus]